MSDEDRIVTLAILISSIACALIVSFICSLMEAALLSITPSQLAELKQRNHKIGTIVKHLKEDIARPIAVILISNTAAHTIGAAIAGAQFGKLYGNSWLWIFSLIFTLAMVQYTEILPKNLGVRFNKTVLAYTAHGLQMMGVILLPLIKLVYFFNRPFEVKNEEDINDTADEISALAGEARDSQQINQRQERIIKAAPRLSEQTALQVMLPVENISFLNSDQSLEEAIAAAHIDFHTRYPVAEGGDHNHVIGYVNFKEMVAVHQVNPSKMVANILRPISFSKPDDTAANLLEQFATQHVHLSIVRDENNMTLGMVTLEDIVEELVGDLDDEFDSLPRTLYSPNDGFWVIGGGNPMSVLAREMYIDLPKRTEPLSMWFSRMLQHPPKVGDTLKYHNAEFTVRKVRRGRALEFNVRRIEMPTENYQE